MRRVQQHAVVALPALDVRRRPAHEAELGTQLMMGEVVRLLDPHHDRPWWKVEGPDGYRGWARSWGLIRTTPSRARRWLTRARGRVRELYAEVRTERGRGALVSPLFWNGRVILGTRRGAWSRVELPDGRRGWVAASAVAGPGAKPVTLVQRLRNLLGSPYLWGGRTAMGFDCSGLIQQMYADQGIVLPRDADDQARATRPLVRNEEPRLGDLVFFGPRRGRILHVGLCLGGGLYAHARGRVMVSSLDPSNAIFDKALAATVRSVGRVVLAPRRKPRRRSKTTISR